MSPYAQLFEALNAANVRYVVVGGIAVVLHGAVRLTIDLDLVVDLSPAEASKAMDALTASGFVPVVPVAARDFADAATRESWVREKHMQVFPMRDPDDITRRVDVFVQQPVPFEELWDRSVTVPFGGTAVRIASVRDLITMKRIAARPVDLDDIEALEALRGDGSDDGT